LRIQQFLEDQELAESTKWGYERDLKAFAQFAGCQEQEPTEDAIRNYIRELRKRARSNSHISRILYSLKRYCLGAGLDLFKPGRIQIPGFEFRTILPSDVITEDQLMALMDAAGTPLEKALVAVLYDSGCRIGELLRLDAEADMDWEHGVLYITGKGSKRRREAIALYPETFTLLQEYRDWRGIKAGPLFPYRYHDIRKWVQLLAARAKVTFPRHSLMHNLRHARAGHMRKAGVPIDVIADQLRHRNISTTLRIYARFAPEELRDRGQPPPWARKNKEGSE